MLIPCLICTFVASYLYHSGRGFWWIFALLAVVNMVCWIFEYPPQPVPYNEEWVRTRAHQLWEAAGRPEGDGLRFWLEAEVEWQTRSKS